MDLTEAVLFHLACGPGDPLPKADSQDHPDRPRYDPAASWHRRGDLR